MVHKTEISILIEWTSNAKYKFLSALYRRIV